jgi:hypothetical protein
VLLQNIAIESFTILIIAKKMSIEITADKIKAGKAPTHNLNGLTIQATGSRFLVAVSTSEFGTVPNFYADSLAEIQAALNACRVRDYYGLEYQLDFCTEKVQVLCVLAAQDINFDTIKSCKTWIKEFVTTY